MCGIIGYTGQRHASTILLEGLKRLEYRGYDSAGIGLQPLDASGKLTVFKKKGKIKDLSSIVPENCPGIAGIGHTRWATHGEVNDTNAHPHTSVDGKISICHNGIIENFMNLREQLVLDGVQFQSKTDSEVIVHLIASFYNGDLEKALKQTLALLKGTYGIVCVHADHPGLIVGARNGSPLVLGIGSDEMFLASDVSAIISHTKQVVYIEDGEVITITPESYRTSDIHNQIVDKKVENITWKLEEMEKNGYEHYMLKEIFEQTESITRAMAGRYDLDQVSVKLGGLNIPRKDLLHIERITIIAAGTSYHAGMVGAYLLESLARIPARAELASELRYRNPIVEKNTLFFAISQSGETADTLYAMRELQRKGATVLGICNVVGSTIPRESNGGVYIHSGPEISVASTKAFTSQMTALYLFALLMARMRDLSIPYGRSIMQGLLHVPEQIRSLMAQKDAIRDIAQKYAQAKSFLFLGRGINYPVAMEGALKLKEISYIHAEGYSAAEIKHGPIALINPETPSLFLVPDDHLREKIVSNIKEIKARKGKVIAIAVEGDDEVASIVDDVFFVPKAHEYMYPFLMTIPLQLFSYYCALELGCDVDQPRNLAKSVTVE